MHALLFQALTVLAATAGAGAEDNGVLAQLVNQGVTMPGGASFKLPPPTLADGMDSAAQTAAITKIAAPRSFEQFVDKSSSAPLMVKIRTFKGENELVYRTVDIAFVAHGSWDVLLSEKFGKSFLKAKEQEREKSDKAKIVEKAGFLTEEEMHKRELASSTRPGQEDRFFYTTFTLFDQVKVSATRYAMLTRSPNSVLLATRIDPRFANDAEYPNQWRSVERNAEGKIVYAPPQPYQGAGFYIKVTKLAEPAGAIFVEYHSVFHEPKGWFDGENLLRAKLPTIAQHQAQQFRGKFAKASQEQ